MDKITYLAELAEGLARWVPERERQDILRYYAEYFEDAGYEREAEVMAELGDPWALSCRLALEGGYVTQEQAMSWKPRKTWPKVLIGTAVGLTVFALVSGIGLLAFNAVSFVRGFGFGRSTAVAVASEPEMSVAYEQVLDGTVTIVDSGYVNVVEDPALTGFYFIGNGSLDNFGSIDADISLGDIQVVAGDGYTLSIACSEALSGYEPTWEVIDGVLRLRDGVRDGGGPQVQVNSWDDLKNLFGVSQQAVKVIITVPEGLILDRISVNVGLGDVLLWGVNAKTVTAETGLGNVECYNALEVRCVELATGKGDVGLILEEALNGLDIRLESGMGNVEATLCGAEKDYSYELESGLSLVSVNGAVLGAKAERRGGAPYRLDAASGTGSVNVHFTFD